MSLAFALSDEEVSIARDAVRAHPALRNPDDNRKPARHGYRLKANAGKAWFDTMQENILKTAHFFVRTACQRNYRRRLSFAVLVQAVDQVAAPGVCKR